MQCPVRVTEARVHTERWGEGQFSVLTSGSKAVKERDEQKVVFHAFLLLSPPFSFMMPLVLSYIMLKFSNGASLKCLPVTLCILVVIDIVVFRQRTNHRSYFAIFSWTSTHFWALILCQRTTAQSRLVWGAYFAFWLPNITPCCSTDCVTFKPLFH